MSAHLCGGYRRQTSGARQLLPQPLKGESELEKEQQLGIQGRANRAGEVSPAVAAAVAHGGPVLGCGGDGGPVLVLVGVSL